MRVPHVVLAVLFLLPTALPLAPGVAAQAPDPCQPPELDVLFVLDTTGSMGGVLQTVKDEAATIMARVATDVPGVWFGAAHYEDYPGQYTTSHGPTTYGAPTDTPWSLVQGLTGTHASVDSAVQGIGLGGGADGPESLTRALHESDQPAVGWRSNSIRVVVLFTDAPGHDEDFGGYDTGPDPGPDAVQATSDDLDFQAVVQDLAGSDTRVIAVQSGGGAQTAAWLAHAATETDGVHVSLQGAPGNDAGGYIADLILSLSPQTAMAEAYDLYVGLDLPGVPAQVLVDRLNLQQAPSGGNHEQLAASVAVPLHTGQTLRVDAGLLDSEATGTIQTHRSDAHAAARIERFSIHLDTTLLLRAEALSSEAGATAMVSGTTTTGTARLAYVDSDLLGAPLPLSAAPQNQAVPLVGGGGLVLGERVGGSTPGGGWVESNAIHLTQPLAVGTLDIIVAHAFAGATCYDERTWTWTPPTDDPAVPDCVLEPPVEDTARRAPVAGPTLDGVLRQWDGVELHVCDPCGGAPPAPGVLDTPGVIHAPSVDCGPCDDVGTPRPLVDAGVAVDVECDPCPRLDKLDGTAAPGGRSLPEPCDDGGQPPVCHDPLVSSVLRRPFCVSWPVPPACEDAVARRDPADVQGCLARLQFPV